MNPATPRAVPREHRQRNRCDPRVYNSRVSLFRTQAQSLKRIWRQLAAGGLDAYDVPGDHFNLMQEPHVQVLAAGIAQRLAQARQGRV